jgi:hypothetical protein
MAPLAGVSIQRQFRSACSHSLSVSCPQSTGYESKQVLKTHLSGKFDAGTATISDVAQEQSLRLIEISPMSRPCSSRLAESCPATTVSQKLPGSA